MIADAWAAVEAELDAAITQRLMTATERRLRHALDGAWVAQGRAFIRRLRANRALFEAARCQPVIIEALTEDEWLPLWEAAAADTFDLFVEPLVAALSAAYSAAMEATLASFADEISPSVTASLRASFSLENPRAVAFLAEYGAARVTSINETTRDQLRTLLTMAADEGWSYTRTARLIRQEFRGFGGPVPHGYLRNRAELVAVTEINNAASYAQNQVGQGLQASGLPMEKSWLTASNPCPQCVANRADGWIPLDQAFSSGAMQPTQHPGCRCSNAMRRVGAGA